VISEVLIHDGGEGVKELVVHIMVTRKRRERERERERTCVADFLSLWPLPLG
jgi:hypothetical protein